MVQWCILCESTVDETSGHLLSDNQSWICAKCNNVLNLKCREVMNEKR